MGKSDGYVETVAAITKMFGLWFDENAKADMNVINSFESGG